MIEVMMSQVKWGIGELPEGAQLNFLHEESNTAYYVPFGNDSFFNFVKQAVGHLTEEQKRLLMPELTNGLHLPGRDFDPKKPPQG